MSIPTHISIIMDGNRRWAKKHKLAVLKGHEYAANNVLERIVEHAAKIGVKYVTFWAFSTENWQRSKPEVEGLLNILKISLKTKIGSFLKKGVCLKVIGDISKFPKDLQGGIAEAIEKTKNCKNITVVLAVNYGGRDEIIRAVNKIVSNISKSVTQKKSEVDFAQYLDTVGIPDPELIIRTGGEKRLSGFLLWQSEYSELYFTDKLWPDFKEKDLDVAVEEFSFRQRRFGK